MKEYAKFEDLKGKILVQIDINQEKDSIIFVTKDGEIYKSYHEQDCCESVYIDDINGDINALLNSEILQAEEATNNDDIINGLPSYPDSFTWTFYKLATIKGYVTIRWLGESNGYYSESVDFVKADSNGNFSRW